MIFILRERGREEREKWICCFCTPPTGDQTHNWDLNWQTFDAQPTESYQSGQILQILKDPSFSPFFTSIKWPFLLGEAVQWINSPSAPHQQKALSFSYLSNYNRDSHIISNYGNEEVWHRGWGKGENKKIDALCYRNQ